MKAKQETSPEQVSELLENAQIVIPEKGVYEKIRSAEIEGRQLRVKMGFDPTSPDLHIGHAVSILQVKKFQELGHLPVIIIGDFTGRIGDPTGRNKSRPLATAEELEKNAQTYIKQLGKILDVSKIEVRHNSEWLEGMSLTDVISLLAQGTLSQTISRDDFRKRLDEGSPVALHEIIYPFLQGMDSVAVNADIEVGGVDQLYAFQAARTLQNNASGDSEALVLMPLLRGLDGTKKMSKTLGNYIGLTDSPRDMFGKAMSIPDTLIEEYLHLASTFSNHEIESMLNDISQGRNPMDVKLALAHNITQIYHSESQADSALEYFNNQFRDKNNQAEYEIATVYQAENVIELLMALQATKTRSEARRLIQQGGLTINDERVKNPDETLEILDGIRVKIGKRRFYQIKTGK